ncbi:MAG: ATP-binding protein [Candidatus Omnitrophica bacterium]|nr:ATP-binding protein [Candidatus Omnitrophota bacterium]
MIPRHVSACLRRSTRSVLLLGPRQTGKSTLVRSLQPDLTVNLAHEPTYLQFARNPAELEERLAAGRFKTVFIDEVQRLPSLLNTIQVLLDESDRRIKYYLTGSSARKLKRGHANLLPGRIHTYHLGSVVASELEYRLQTSKALEIGTLPGIWTEPDAGTQRKTLQTYASTYLKEEIQAEALTRNIEGFSRFLFVVAAEAGKFLDLSKLASAAGVPRQSAVRFFELLEDTLVLRRCEAFRKSERRRLTQSPRHFFFDTGVLNGLLNNFTASGDRLGMLFEHLLFNQLVDSALAKDQSLRISSYRTEHGAEVDFIVEYGRHVLAIEAKASSTIGRSDLRGFRSFAEYYGKKHRSVIAYLGSVRKVIDGIEVLPWQSLLNDLGL